MSANENQLQIEVLQPEISSQIQKTTREELKNWIKDGKLKPTHQIRIKNLNWVEAQKIPAFQALFEAKKSEPEVQANHCNNQNSSNSSVPKPGNSKIIEATIFSKKMSSPASTKNEPSDNTVENKPKTVKPSAAFKLFEKKALAKSKKIESKNERIEPKSKKIESKNKPFRSLPERPKKSLIVKKSLGFLAGCVVMFMLSLGGS